MRQDTGWNNWYAREDNYGCTEWDAVTQDDFDRWALSGADLDEVFDVEATAAEYLDNMVYLAKSEVRHIPYSTRDEFMDDCRDFVETWNERARALIDERDGDE